MPLLALMTMSDSDRRPPVHVEHDETGLEEELRQAAARFDPVPGELLRAADEAYTWRTIDAELAELAYDSLVDQDEISLVLGPPERRLLSFQAGRLTIDLEITRTGSARGLVGQLVPPRPATVEIRVGGTSIAVDADELGRFRAGPVSAGPMSLRCSVGPAEPGTAVVTDWVSI
jgi:hypothetical protein